MNTNNQPLDEVKGTSTLVRAKFGPGMLLQHDDLEQLNIYTQELNRLMFRSLFGCGVVCGLAVKVDVDCGEVQVAVASGLALDCQGDPIYVPKEQKLHFDPGLASKAWVVLCRTEKCCSPRTSVCAADDDESPSVCTREREGFVIRVMRARPPCTCGCAEPGQDNPSQAVSDDGCWCVDPTHPCYEKHYRGECGCECGDCASCDCDCVLLARLESVGTDPKKPEWSVDHRVRRFVRPMLMRDWVVHEEEQKRREKEKGKEKSRDKGKDVKGQEQHGESRQDDTQQSETKGAGKETPPKYTPPKDTKETPGKR
jgi:hypothetical protein